MNAVVRLVAVAVCATFATLLPAAGLALATGDLALAVEMGLVALLGGLMGGLVLLANAGRPRALRRMNGLLAVVLAWITCAAGAALAMAELFELSFARALFEAAAALTTTGQSLLGERAAIAAPLLLWRVTLEWFGGLLTLVCLLQIVAPAGLGGLPQFTGRLFTTPARGPRRDSGQRRDTGERGVQDEMTLSRSRRIAQRYALVTLGFWGVFMLVGLPPLEASMLAMVGVATGGFVFFDAPVVDVLGTSGMLALALAFILGATSILWRSGAGQGVGRGGRQSAFDLARFRRANVEAIAITTIAAFTAAVLLIRLSAVSGEGVLNGEVLAESVLGAASLVATSGIESRPGFLALLPDVALLMLVFTGASLFSTTGGVKLYRVVGLARYAENELVNLIYPSAVSPLAVGGRPVADATLGAIWAYFVFAVAFVALAAFGLALGPFAFEAGFKAAVALFTNAGPLYDAMVPQAAGAAEGWPAFRDLDAPLLAWASFVMLLGRLEILVVFAALNIRFWTGR